MSSSSVAKQDDRDERLARGGGRFAADHAETGLAHLLLVRSTVAHADVSAVDVDAARQVSGVLDVLTAADLAEPGGGALPGSVRGRPVLAGDRVRFQGQEVVAVVAETPYAAADAAELVDIEYEPLPVIVDREQAAASEEVAGPPTRSAAGEDAGSGKPAAVVEAVLEYPRSHPAALETAACVAVPENGKLKVALTLQNAEAHREALAAAAGLEANRLVLEEVDLGGGFGGKSTLLPGHVLPLVAAERLGRPVRWMELRSETHVSTVAVGDSTLRGRLALGADGKFLSIEIKLQADAGAYPTEDWEALPEAALALLRESYPDASARIEVEAVATNKSPITALSGGLPKAAEIVTLVERLLDRAAAEAGTDPLEARLASASDAARDALRAAADTIGYESARADRDPTARTGVGLASCGAGGQGAVAAVAATVRVEPATGEWSVRRLTVAHPWGPAFDVAVRGGVAQGYGLASMQAMSIDPDGNCLGANFMDYLLPTAWEAPKIEVARSGKKASAAAPEFVSGVASATAIAACAGAVEDALRDAGVTDLPLPITSGAVWDALAAACGGA